MDLYEGLSEPVRAAWERSLATGRASLSRRALLRAGGAAGLTAAGLSALTACGIPPATRTAASGDSYDVSGKEKVVDFSNWSLYIDTDDKDQNKRPTLLAFTKATGIKVNYTEDISDNVEFFGKIKPQLAAGQDTGRDLMVLTDWMAGRVIRLGWAERLDNEYLPHAYANLAEQYRSPDWDPGRAHSYPWAGGATVVAYNAKATGGKQVSSVSQLLDDPALKGRVTMLLEMRDTVGLTLIDMGKDPASFTDDDFDAAIARIQKGVDDKQIRKFDNEYPKGLASGDIAACLAWAGDLVQLRADNPDIKFVIPQAGYMSWSDNMLIPARARHKTNAEKLMDWYYRPEIAAELADWVNYFSPVDGVKQALEKIDPDAANNPLILPPPAMVAKGRAFRTLSEDEEARYEAEFAKVTGA